MSAFYVIFIVGISFIFSYLTNIMSNVWKSSHVVKVQ